VSRQLSERTARPARVELRGWGWRHAGRRDWALRGVDLVVEAGERVLLLGPSGAGKSTLLAALAGLPDPETAGESEGLLLVDGHPARDVRHRTGLVLQDPETQLVMARAGDDVAFGLENRAVPAEQIWARVDEALAVVGFGYGRDRQTASLSGGEKQRLAIAGVLALRPGLLLLDEPTANLDPGGAELVRAALAAVLDATGATTLIVEHRVAAALPLVHRVVVVEPGGGVVADGTPGEVFATHGAALAARGVWVPGHTDVRPRRATAPPGETALQACGAGYRYPGSPAPAAPPADVTLRRGEAVALTGANGSGKSTLAMLLAGLRSPTMGTVRATGRALPLHRWRARDLAGTVGTVFQEPEHQFLARTVAEELDLGPVRRGTPPAEARRRTTDLLERLHLDRLAAANPFTLSGGEKRRLSVATALATAPEVLVLDEPTFGQDARTWAELLTLLAELRDEGRAVLAVTHDEAFAAALADRHLAL
jgi:energy-coupling factor transport system ATP-binding protein